MWDLILSVLDLIFLDLISLQAGLSLGQSVLEHLKFFFCVKQEKCHLRLQRQY